MFKTMTLMLALLCSPMLLGTAFAHGDGGHGTVLKAEDALILASKYVVSLVKKQSKIEGSPLDESWLKIPEDKKKIERTEAWYFVISFKHDEKGKMLYLMVSKKGKLYRADYQGVFKEFK